jgi:hypothetical protein
MAKPPIKQKRVQHQRKINTWEEWLVGLSDRAKADVSIEEIRRQGLELAGRRLGQGARSAQSVRSPNSASPRRKGRSAV